MIPRGGKQTLYGGLGVETGLEVVKNSVQLSRDYHIMQIIGVDIRRLQR